MIEDPREVARSTALPAPLQRRWTAALGWTGGILAIVGHLALMATGRGADPISFLFPVLVVGFLAVPAVLRRGRSTATATGLLLATTLVAIFVGSALGSGLGAPLLAALPALTLLAVLLASVREGILATLGAAAGLLLLALWQAVGAAAAPIDGGQVLRAALLLAACGIALALASLYASDLARLSHALHAATTSDPLTGLANRDSLDDVLALEHHRLGRHPAGSLAVILVDIDHFEEYAQAYGRQAADELVRKIAETARLRVRRAPDLLGRQGDSELLAVLPATGGADAAVVAECIRRDVEALELAHGAADLGMVTVSLGVAAERAGSERSIDALLGEAGRALRGARLAGGNRVATGAAAEAAS